MNTSVPSLTDRALDIARGAMEPGRYDREQRSFRRRPYHGWVAFMTVAPGGRATTPVTLRGRDVSGGGMGVISGRHLEPGSRGALLIRRSDGNPMVLSVTVVYCNRRDVMDFECGLRFLPGQSCVDVEAFRLSDGLLPEIGPASSAE